MHKTGIVRDNRYKHHNPGTFHPENAQRLEAVYDMLDEPEIRPYYTEIPARPATREELLLIHDAAYVDRVAATTGRGPVALDPDTVTSAASYEAALLAAGGLCAAVDGVVEKRVPHAFALVRPPGHHAERNQARGFCLFNNVAVAARYAQRHHGLARILIVDWDLHHGNGTQHAFEDDPTVLYFSTHQYPYYPGTGAFTEVGFGKGAGYTLNIPLSVGHGDAEFLALFQEVLRPVAEEFQPELVLVSAGFDIYAGDPLGGMRVTPPGFAAMTRILMELAAKTCQGRLAFTLEGGYDLKGLRDSVKAVLLELAGATATAPEEMAAGADRGRVERLFSQVEKAHGAFWKPLRR